MKVLIVFAHPNPDSFNQAILKTLSRGLAEAGHEMRVKDLYREGFDPLLDRHRLAEMSAGVIPDDVKREQDMLRWADGLVFIYPLWWFDRPAILKGWFDRVFTNGFAFRYTSEGLQGLLPHKKALVIVTAGGTAADHEALNVRDYIVRPTTDGTLAFCGIRNILDKVLYGVPVISDEARKEMLAEIYELGRGF